MTGSTAHAPAPVPRPASAAGAPTPAGAAPASAREARRPSRTARQVGFGIAAGINALLLYLVNVTPGWEWVTFLSEDFTRVLGVLNASLVVALVVNLLWMVADPMWFRALGQVVQSAVGLAVVLTALDVFPFDYSDWAFDATWLTRLVLVVAAVATGIGLLVQLVTLVRVVVTSASR
jgi:hypothetical protein